MKTLLTALAFVLLSLRAFAQAAPPTATIACDVAAPLNGITAVRFYERTGTAPAFSYALIVEVPVSTAGTVQGIIPLTPDGLTHFIVARTVAGVSTVLPATDAVIASESVDSNPVSVSAEGGDGETR